MSNKEKNARINIRITEDLKTDFYMICENNMQNPSTVIRELIKSFIKENNGTLKGSD